jgi:hypothetical protein
LKHRHANKTFSPIIIVVVWIHLQFLTLIHWEVIVTNPGPQTAKPKPAFCCAGWANW